MKKEQIFFSEKKKRKTLVIQGVMWPARSATAFGKVFWFFSSEKNACFCAIAGWLNA
jgi:hypothetical protein